MQKFALRLQISGYLLELCKDCRIVGFPGSRGLRVSVQDQQHEFHRQRSTRSGSDHFVSCRKHAPQAPPDFYISQTWRTSIWKKGGNFLAHSSASASEAKSPR